MFFAGYGDLVAALQRLQSQLNKQGMASLAGRVTAAQTVLLGPGVANALRIRETVLQRRRPRVQNPLSSNAQTLAKDVSGISNFIDCFRVFSSIKINFCLYFCCSVWKAYRNRAPRWPLNCAIYSLHTKWRDCCKPMTVLHPPLIDRRRQMCLQRGRWMAARILLPINRSIRILLIIMY